MTKVIWKVDRPRGGLASAFAAGEEPVLPAEGNRGIYRKERKERKGQEQLRGA